MPSKRLLSIEYFHDYALSKLPVAARYLYAGMWCLADDQGVCKYDVTEWKREVFTWDNEMSFERLEELFEELHTIRRVAVFMIQEKKYVWIPTLLKNQPGLAKLCRLHPGPPAALQLEMLGEVGAKEYNATIARLDARREAARVRAKERSDKAASEGKPSDATTDKATALSPEIARAAEQLLGRPVSPKERQVLVATLATAGVKPEWLPRAFTETQAKRSVEYACTVVRRWAVEGPAPRKPTEDRYEYPELPDLPTLPKRTQAPAPRDPSKPPIMRVIHDRMAEMDAAEGRR